MNVGQQMAPKNDPNDSIVLQRSQTDHWSDVLIGWLQGTVSAIVVCVYVAKLHRKREEQFYQPVVLIQPESTDSVA